MIIINLFKIFLMIFLVMSLIIMNNTFLMNFQMLIILNEMFLNLYKNFILVMDIYSSSFFFIVSIVVMNVLSFMNIYMNMNKNMKVFFFMTKIFVISMFLLVFSFNLWTMIMGWEGLGMSSFFLIFYYNNFESWKSAIKTFINNKMGDCLILMSMIYSTINLNSFKMVGLMFLISMMTKSAQYPFMSWLPMAMAAPTPISAMVHSSTLVTAGLFIMFRLINNFFSKTNLNLITNLCLLSMFISGFKAMSEKDMKKMIALSTLSQISLIFFFLINNMKIIAFIYMCNHALFKSLIFINMGLMMMNNFSNQLKFNMLNKNMCSNFILSYKVSCLNLMNMSFFSSFFIKEKMLMKLSSNFFSMMKFTIFMVSSFFTMNYSLKMMLFFNKSNFKIKKNNMFEKKNYSKSFFLMNIFSIFYSKIMMEMILFVNMMNSLIMTFYLISMMMNFKIYSKKINFTSSLAYTEFNMYIYPFKMIKYNLDINELWMEKISLNFYFLMKNKIIFKTFNMNFNLIMMLFIIMMFI
uniref:NADH:ubiquinone reductase (H(+)-translocating) n=1 Tax=Tetranychus kanzawai TaxID=50028 RepID=A0A075XA09_TETKA|nr:NADH dehydrogenase subunit 5 [Tetranychus kanzawai]AIH15650.1 NADH dehydrogenase subunit 5 [Tetranychus kanzawai]